MNKNEIKQNFVNIFREFLKTIQADVMQDDLQWRIKGFIDDRKNIFSISNDTKIVSKILEIHIFPYILDFAKKHSFEIVLPEHQNYYPDLSLVCKTHRDIKFAIDLKTTYRIQKDSNKCNGFTLGSHGEYFKDRQSNKNIQFPYAQYLGHFCLGVIYDRVLVDEFQKFKLDDLDSIKSVIKNLKLFFVEKYKIASDSSGSGNTANIGSIKNINDILNENGVFARLGEDIFDDYWINYGQITQNSNGVNKKITNINDYLAYRGKK